MLEPGAHTVELVSLVTVDSDTTDHLYGASSFNYCGGGGIYADYDGDCDVDWYDFAKLAEVWLADTAATAPAFECPGGCSGHGVCVGPNECVCEIGWMGVDCSIPVP
jgi:hypothetical protein